VTGRMYAGGRKAKREKRRVQARRDNWRDAALCMALAGVATGGGAAWLLWVGVGELVMLALALATATAVLFGAAALAQLRAERLADPEPLMPSPADGAQTIDLVEAIAQESARNPQFLARVRAASQRARRSR
jgi:hypothetical protein